MIETFRRQTAFIKACIQDVIKPGDSAIDATVGTGEDTVFLAECVGKTGHVYGFDIQRAAIEEAKALAAQHGVSERITWLFNGHEHMNTYPDIAQNPKIGAVTFNLGYWPDGDPGVTTQPETTFQALEQSAPLLRSGGILTVCAYSHLTGQAEKEKIEAWIQNLGRGYDAYSFEVKNHREAPTAFIVLKK